MDSKIEFNELCRLCLAKNHVGIPIFEGEGHDEVFLKISTCLPVNISYEDKLPKRICTNCLNKLNILYKFCNKSANSEKQLLDWFNQYGTENETSIDSNVDYETAQSDSEIEIKEEALSFLTDEDDNIKIEDTDMENYNILQDIPKQGNDISNEQCSDTIGFNAVTNGTEVEVKQENDDDDDGKPKTTNLQPEVNTKYAKMLERRAKMGVNEDSQLHFENDLNCNLMNNNNVIYELEVMTENQNLTASANLNIDLMMTHNNINLPQMEVFQDDVIVIGNGESQDLDDETNNLCVNKKIKSINNLESTEICKEGLVDPDFEPLSDDSETCAEDITENIEAIQEEMIGKAENNLSENKTPNDKTHLVLHENNKNKREKHSNPGLWKKNENKNLGMLGQNYIGSTHNKEGQIKQDIEKCHRKLGPTCDSSFCKKSANRFCQKFLDPEREVILKSFWNMSWQQKRLFILHMVVYKPKAKSYISTPSRRKGTYEYFIKSGSDNYQVCKKMFLNTLGVKEKLIRYWVSKGDKHGLLNNLSDDNITEEIKGQNSQHCKDENVKSSYCRKDTEELDVEQDLKSNSTKTKEKKTTNEKKKTTKAKSAKTKEKKDL